tara:strand:- start:657 stop:1151 length:495 start_codon:yes stop_codon:yes gene_type:complete
MNSKIYRYNALLGAAVASLLSFEAALAGAGHTAGSHHTTATSDADAIRTIEVIARDNEFSTDEIQVSPGETVRFLIRNEGELDHDFTIGDADTQTAHRAEMQAMMSGASDGHAHKHQAQNAVMVAPGETTELVWTFGEGESLEFGCNIPGHFESGMRGKFELRS